MEILFGIFAAIFSIITVVFGVKNRIKNSRLGTRRDIRDEGSRYNGLVQNRDRLERDKDRIQELDKRDDGNIERCKDISSRIRKREQETTTE